MEKVDRLTNDWQTARDKTYKNNEMINTETSSGLSVKEVYTPTDVKDDYDRIGMPGIYPYTRGIYPLQYKYTPWVNQPVFGYGLPEDTNKRMTFLLEQGMKGYGGRPAFNVAFDLPTQAGFDPGDKVAKGKIGYCGVNCVHVGDMERLFAGMDQQKLSASMIMPSGSNVALPLYIALGRKRGVTPDKLRGNTMNYLYCNFHMDRFNFPPKPSMRLMVDLIKYCTENMPQWNTTNLQGYDLRESGASAPQEVGLILATSKALTEEAIKVGLDPNDFLPRFSFQLDVTMDLFEDIAKLRALRRMWAVMNKEYFGATNPKALQARMHIHTSGSALTAQQPYNNIVRASLQTLAAVLGGANSIQTSAFDEALSIPSDFAATMSLRTQQIIREETNVIAVADPLGGSYYVESLTDQIEEEASKWMKKVDEVGGFVKAWETGWLRNVVASENYRTAEKVRKGQQKIIGLNMYEEKDEKIDIPVFEVDPKWEEIAIQRLADHKSKRDNTLVAKTLAEMKKACLSNEHIMPYTVETACAGATCGEMMQVFKEVFGFNMVYQGG